jgi:hypothetical protein
VGLLIFGFDRPLGNNPTRLQNLATQFNLAAKKAEMKKCQVRYDSKWPQNRPEDR